MSLADRILGSLWPPLPSPIFTSVSEVVRLDSLYIILSFCVRPVPWSVTQWLMKWVNVFPQIIRVLQPRSYWRGSNLWSLVTGRSDQSEGRPVQFHHHKGSTALILRIHYFIILTTVPQLPSFLCHSVASVGGYDMKDATEIINYMLKNPLEVVN